MEITLYIGSKKASMPQNIYIVICMHKTSKNQKEIYFEQNTK